MWQRVQTQSPLRTLSELWVLPMYIGTTFLLCDALCDTFSTKCLLHYLSTLSRCYIEGPPQIKHSLLGSLLVNWLYNWDKVYFECTLYSVCDRCERQPVAFCSHSGREWSLFNKLADNFKGRKEMSWIKSEFDTFYIWLGPHVFMPISQILVSCSAYRVASRKLGVVWVCLLYEWKVPFTL